MTARTAILISRCDGASVAGETSATCEPVAPTPDGTQRIIATKASMNIHFFIGVPVVYEITARAPEVRVFDLPAIQAAVADGLHVSGALVSSQATSG